MSKDLGGPREPSGVARASARSLKDLFDACIEQGFTSDQALDIVCAIAKGSAAKLGGVPQ